MFFLIRAKNVEGRCKTMKMHVFPALTLTGGWGGKQGQEKCNGAVGRGFIPGTNPPAKIERPDTRRSRVQTRAISRSLPISRLIGTDHCSMNALAICHGFWAPGNNRTASNRNQLPEFTCWSKSLYNQVHPWRLTISTLKNPMNPRPMPLLSWKANSRRTKLPRSQPTQETRPRLSKQRSPRISATATKCSATETPL